MHTALLSGLVPNSSQPSSYLSTFRPDFLANFLTLRPTFHCPEALVIYVTPDTHYPVIMASFSSNPHADRDMEMMEFIIGQLTGQGRYTEAAEMGQRLLEKSRSTLGPEHPRTLSTMYYFGAMTHVAGKFEQAERIFRQLLPLREKVLGQDDPGTIAVLDAISESLSSMRKYKEALKILNDELQRCERKFGSEHELTIKTLKNMGQVYLMQGDSHLAISVLLRALELSEKLHGPTHATTKRIQDHLTEIRGPQDSLLLRQMLAAKHGLPIPGDPLAGIKSMDQWQLFRRYKNVTGMMSAGQEVSYATAMKFSEKMGYDPQPPIHVPSHYNDEEKYEDDGIGAYPEQLEIRTKYLD